MSESSSSSLPSSVSSASSCTRGVKLRRFAQERYVANAVDGFRFQVVAYAECGMPKDIFLYLRKPYDPTTGADRDEFQGVASPSDLEEYPAGAPIVGSQPPWWRSHTVDLVFRSQSLAEEAWTALLEEVGILVDTLDLMDELTVIADVAFGTPSDETPPSGG
jgi:hypothetical protein